MDFEGPLTIKTCKERIGVGYHTRHGMFRMDRNDHETLLRVRGSYLFGVEKADGNTQLKLVRADEVDYRDNITWTSIFK